MPTRPTDDGLDPQHLEGMVDVGYREDREILRRLKQGDTEAFAGLVDAYGRSLLRMAHQYVGDRAAAEDVVQETWIGFLESLDRFEGRASLKTWIFHILINQARKRRSKERAIPFSSVGDDVPGPPSVDPDRFIAAGRPGAGCWASPPRGWDLPPEQQLLSREVYEKVAEGLRGLSAAQREVVTLRDLEGWSASEVCDVLGVSQNHQRVLLHRGRSRLRNDLEGYLERVRR